MIQTPSERQSMTVVKLRYRLISAGGSTMVECEEEGCPYRDPANGNEIRGPLTVDPSRSSRSWTPSLTRYGGASSAGFTRLRAT
jgi:hypothetical protein